jgi:hypothetical protein
MVLFIAVLVLFGWQFHIRFLKSPLAHQVNMNPATAITLLLAALSFLLMKNNEHHHKKRELTGKILALVVIGIGTLKLLNNAGIIGISIDQLLFRPAIAADNLQGNLSVIPLITAISFILTGTALLLFPVKTAHEKKSAHYIALLTGALAFFSMVGYLYRVEVFYEALVYIPMAVHTAVSFLLLSLAMLFATPDPGIMKTVTGKYDGTLIARYLIPAALIVPVILGLLRLYGYWTGIFSTEFGGDHPGHEYYYFSFGAYLVYRQVIECQGCREGGRLPGIAEKRGRDRI